MKIHFDVLALSILLLMQLDKILDAQEPQSRLNSGELNLSSVVEGVQAILLSN